MSAQTPVRLPAVAGQFYPGAREPLLREIRRYAPEAKETTHAIGAVVPHAGYMYSGHVAGAVYSHLELPSRFVILCPNHTGLGQSFAIMSRGAWQTPLGNASIDERLASALLDRCSLLHEDSLAHLTEHALEVQLPFLQVLHPDFSFVPIAVGSSNYDDLVELGHAISEVTSTFGERVMVIASSDMNHYETDSLTRIKDRKAIDRVLTLDAPGLYQTVRREQISMCGYAPTVAMLTAAKSLGATSAELVKYATSGDVSGERDMVVGYAGMIVK